MKDIVGRFIFAVWIISGLLTIAFGIVGCDNGVLLFGAIFISPIVLELVYLAVRFVLTGESK